MTHSRTSARPHLFLIWAAFLLLVLTVLLVHEIRTSELEAHYFSKIGRNLSFRVEPGPSDRIMFPQSGPYDHRLGYTQLPAMTRTLMKKGYGLEAQARFSKSLLKLAQMGISPVYPEKFQAGLFIRDQRGREIFAAKYPQRVYPDFKSIPPVVVKTLLFIENRDLLDPRYPYRNPAVAWPRLTKSLVDLAIRYVDDDHWVPGGSTLATQMEKFRHSPGGYTGTIDEKLRQMTAASLRAYLDGEDTLEARRHIVLSYINSVPLAAIPNYGEVHGLGDGLWAWFGTDFWQTNALLQAIGSPDTQASPRLSALAFRKVLTLLLAHRRPSELLTNSRRQLNELTESYLRLLASAGIITPAIRDAALAQKPEFGPHAPFNYQIPLANMKTATLLRTRLLSELGQQQVYDMDRLDLTVDSTLDMDAQEAVIAYLQRLKSPDQVAALGLKAPFLLNTGNPANVIYSLSLYECMPQGNYLRVRANNFDGPFNIDEGTKLDLGSSAKLRTLVTYLQVIENLHTALSSMKSSDLNALLNKPIDPLTHWAATYLATTPGRDLATMLAAALERPYLADPHEYFFTGGGRHQFRNFNAEEDGKAYTVKTAFYNSVNLVFIRLMRDIVYYHIYQRVGLTPGHLNAIAESDLKAYLSKFADQEGQQFIIRFFHKYQDKSLSEIMELLFAGLHPMPRKLAAVLRYIQPQADQSGFTAAMAEHLPGSVLSEATLKSLYERFADEKLSLEDRGFIAHIHPLELWVVRYKLLHPQASLTEMIVNSTDERQQVYAWLFRTRHKPTQFKRIRIILELEAFQDIHQAWQRLGFPFDFLVPSYATSIGSSGDNTIVIGGKTGTGDHRYKTFGPGGAADRIARGQPRSGVRVFHR